MQLVLNRLCSFPSVTLLNRKDVKQNRLQILLISLETGAIHNLTKQVTAAQRWAGPSDRLKHIWIWSAPQRCGSAPHAAFDMTVLTAGPNKTGGFVVCRVCVSACLRTRGLCVFPSFYVCFFVSHRATSTLCSGVHPPIYPQHIQLHMFSILVLISLLFPFSFGLFKQPASCV